MDIFSVRLCAIHCHTCIPILAGISSPQFGTSPTTDSEAADYLSKLLLSVIRFVSEHFITLVQKVFLLKYMVTQFTKTFDCDFFPL